MAIRIPKRTRRVTKTDKAQRQALAAARAVHLRDCPHDGHWLENANGRMVRCPCWRRATMDARGGTA